jgi:hypothetical protein
MSVKMAWLNPFLNPNIAKRELLKPKFYDVWFEVSRKNQLVTPKGGTLYDTHVGQTIKDPVINGELIGKLQWLLILLSTLLICICQLHILSLKVLKTDKFLNVPIWLFLFLKHNSRPNLTSCSHPPSNSLVKGQEEFHLHTNEFEPRTFGGSQCPRRGYIGEPSPLGQCTTVVTNSIEFTCPHLKNAEVVQSLNFQRLSNAKSSR